MASETWSKGTPSRAVGCAPPAGQCTCAYSSVLLLLLHGDPLIARSVTVIYDSSRGRGVLLPSARPQSWGCVVHQGSFVKPGYPLCTRDVK